jgi:hypothetical protein
MEWIQEFAEGWQWSHFVVQQKYKGYGYKKKKKGGT